MNLPWGSFAGGLRPFISSPEAHLCSNYYEAKPGQTIFYDEKFVILTDGFPKATVHLLVMPRSSAATMELLYDSLGDESFREEAETYVTLAKWFAVNMLENRYQQTKAARERRPVPVFLPQDDLPSIPVLELTAELQAESTTNSRDWNDSIACGIHAVPSMRNAHIHVVSRDFHSPRLKQPRHWFSFNSEFFVPFNEKFPLPSDDPRRCFDLMMTLDDGYDYRSGEPLLYSCPYRDCGFGELRSARGALGRFKKHLGVHFERDFMRDVEEGENWVVFK